MALMVQPMRFNPQMIEALEAGRKGATRRIVTGSNSLVQPGRFENVNLDTGRASHVNGRNVIKARCKFPAGERAVTIESKIKPEALLWVRRGQAGGTRASSTLTLEVWAVEVSRLQDMTDKDAIAEGVMPWRNEYAVNEAGDLHYATPRLAFSALWDSINGRGRNGWDANPWVWTYRFTVHQANVDQLLEVKKSA